jgi:predicted GIY-YIG superfamily endonuclease
MIKKYCVYQIEISGNIQIGSTNNIKRRMVEHKSLLRLNKHHNKHMQNVYNKYKHFSYTILYEFDTREEAYSKEQELLNENYGKNNYLMCSNSAIGAPYGDASHMKLDEYKKAASEKCVFKNLKFTGDNNHMKLDYHRKRQSELVKGANNPMYGKTSPMKGKRNEGASIYMKGRDGEKHPMYGKKLSKQHRESISNRTKGHNNPMYGKTGVYSARSIVIIDKETNRFYFSMKEYCQSNNTSMYKCRKMIKNGRLKCTT